MEVRIETLWRTASEQCELVVFGPLEWRLRLWRNGSLVVDEAVSNRAEAVRRSAVLRVERLPVPK